MKQLMYDFILKGVKKLTELQCSVLLHKTLL